MSEKSKIFIHGPKDIQPFEIVEVPESVTQRWLASNLYLVGRMC